MIHLYRLGCFKGITKHVCYSYILNKACRSFFSKAVRFRSPDQHSNALKLNLLAVISFSGITKVYLKSIIN